MEWIFGFIGIALVFFVLLVMVIIWIPFFLFKRATGQGIVTYLSVYFPDTPPEKIRKNLIKFTLIIAGSLLSFTLNKYLKL